MFTFTGTDNQTQPLALTFECRLDSTSELDWFACVSPFNLLEEFPEFAPGPHTFEIRANDNAEPLDPQSPSEGNVDPTPIVHTWTSVADATTPETTILTALLLTNPPAITIEPDVVFTFAGTDNATPLEFLAFECSVDGGAFEPCDSPASVQGLEPGSHTFAVRTVDLALNPDPTPATFTWELVGPPTTTILTRARSRDHQPGRHVHVQRRPGRRRRSSARSTVATSCRAPPRSPTRDSPTASTRSRSRRPTRTA